MILAMASTEKISITLDEGLLEEARARAGDNLSRWIAGAISTQVLLERGREYLREREGERGPLSEELLEEVRRVWPASSSTAAR
jgi:post-segregation antitoxin (ccd killing protein)